MLILDLLQIEGVDVGACMELSGVGGNEVLRTGLADIVGGIGV